MQENNDRVKNHLQGFLFEGAEKCPQFIIYSEEVSSRLRYVCNFIFHQALKTNYIITDNAGKFISSELFKINYSKLEFANTFCVYPSGFLIENGVKEMNPPCTNSGKDFKLFPALQGDLDYDIFSAVFYFISRYEEWQKFVKDNHGRFEIRSSILHKLNAVRYPSVDCSINEFGKKLEVYFRGYKATKPEFRYISTIDVDNLYAFKAKTVFRNTGGGIKSFLRGDINGFWARMATVLFKQKDPFDYYKEQVQISEDTKVPLIYFFLYRNNTNFDRTVKPSHPAFIELFRFLKSKYIAIGLHPSYYSSEHPLLLKKEVENLCKDAALPVIATRQHYLRFNIRTTPKELLENGIEYDFTMGFASTTGFRSGTALPFYYYDFEREKELPLMAVPFALMDGAYYNYMHKNASEAEKEIFELADKVKENGGLFISVFHERSFAGFLYPGWKELYFKLQKNLSSIKTNS